jgi:hypothetical protein
MYRIPALSSAAVLLPLAASLLAPAASVSGQVRLIQTSPMAITTDTPEYCQKLLGRISEMVHLATAPIPHEATDLTVEGQRMCDHGQTRSGIMRLRSALMLMEKGTGPAYR